MKILKSFSLIVLLLFASNAAFAQSKIGGRVIEIVDGKTIIVETFSGSRITAELQYIEVPEFGQPLYETAKNHLQNLVFDKKVEFRARGLTQSKTVGQLFSKGVDISQQMIRDGAAWYAVPQKSGQDAAESEIYRSNEAQAKAEKRGIWSIENLKPSWEIRAEAEENRRRAEKLAAEKMAQEAAAQMTAEATPKAAKPKVRSQMSSESLMWSSAPDAEGEKLPENISNVGGLMVGYNAQYKTGIVFTPMMKLEVPDKSSFQSFGVGVAYLYHDNERLGRKSIYLVGIESASGAYKFLKFNSLTVTADNQKFLIGKAISSKQNDLTAKELLIYKIERSVINKIARAKSVKITVGSYSTNLNFDAQTMLKNLLSASE